jgi:lipopolysaccharide exporter
MRKRRSRRAADARSAQPERSTADRMGPPGDLRRRAAHGFLWTGGATFVGLGVQLAYTAAMGRLVNPAAFGLVAAAGVLISVLSLVSNFGLKSAVVQREQVDAADVRCAFTYAVLIGLTSTVVAVLLSAVAEDIMGVSGLAPLVRVLSLSLLVTSFGVVADARLRREMRYRTVAIVDLSAMACGFLLVGIPLAIAGANEWSLVFAQLSYTFLDAVALLLIARHSLVPIFSWARARRFVLFGGGVSALSLLEYGGSNLDTVGVSRYLGATDLGQYSRATLLFSLPAYKATIAFSSVLFPALARVQSSRERVRAILEQSLGGVTMLVIPASIVTGFAAPALVRVVLGSSWGPAAQVLPILALASALGLATHVIALTFEAIGRLQEKFVIQAFRVLLLATALAGVVLAGPSLSRFAFAWLCVQVLEYLAYIVAARLRLGSSIEVMVFQLARATATGLVCAIPSFLIVRLAGETGMVGCAVAGLGAVAILVVLWRTPMLADARNVLQMLKEGIRRPAAADLSDPSAGGVGFGVEPMPPTRDRSS